MKKDFLENIKINIERYGQHVTFVKAGIVPSFAYTIGLSEFEKFELIMAGSIFYSFNQTIEILNIISEKIKKEGVKEQFEYDIKNFGKFSLIPTTQSWNKATMLGVFDYYGVDEINAFQVLPEDKNNTFLTPKMNNSNELYSNKIWSKISNNLINYNNQLNEAIVINLDALRGNSINQVTRWEEDYWEVFAINKNEEISQENCRIISFDILMELDSELQFIKNIPLEKKYYKKGNNDWEII